MICPDCGGKGGDTYDVFGWVKCRTCNGTGEVEQTNEEWLKSLNTERLAEWLSLNLCEKTFRCTLIEAGMCKGNDYKEDYNAWLKWLKAKGGKKE